MKNRYSKSILQTLLLLSLIFASISVWAAPITFNFEGNLTGGATSSFGGVGQMPADLAHTFTLGDKLTGSYTFESSAVAYHSATNLEQYLLNNFTFKLGNYSGSLNPYGGGNILLHDFPASDGYYVKADIAGENAFTIGPPGEFRISLFDSEAEAMNGLGLPLLPPNLSDFTENTWQLEFVRGEYSFYVFGDLTSLTLGDTSAPVPEPATFLLLGGGLAGLAFYRRKRK